MYRRDATLDTMRKRIYAVAAEVETNDGLSLDNPFAGKRRGAKVI
jgi:hypothetical protein